jgi:hypothetical protein
MFFLLSLFGPNPSTTTITDFLRFMLILMEMTRSDSKDCPDGNQRTQLDPLVSKVFSMMLGDPFQSSNPFMESRLEFAREEYLRHQIAPPATNFSHG